MKKEQTQEAGFNFSASPYGSSNNNNSSNGLSEYGISSSNSSLMTLYHSSPCLKKVLSEQFLNQLKSKTEVDSIRQQMQVLQEKLNYKSSDNLKP